MKITKLGHCCLLVEEKGLRILFDPGNYTTAQNDLKNLDLVLLTQEHGDHLDLGSLRLVLKNNPQAQIFTNQGVGKILIKENIAYQLLEDGQKFEVKKVLIEAWGKIHAVIYPPLPPVENTGYFINQRFFYPGDALINPQKPLEILALPVVGPWLKVSEAIDYALLLKPRVCFPVHDGMLKDFGGFHKWPKHFLATAGIQFISPALGQELEF